MIRIYGTLLVFYGTSDTGKVDQLSVEASDQRNPICMNVSTLPLKLNSASYSVFGQSYSCSKIHLIPGN